MVVGQTLALTAGLCGALAATSAKLAMAADSAEETCNMVIVRIFTNSWTHLCSTVLIYIRLACFGLIFLFNALMWTLFIKSLQRCRTSLEATVTNTGANIGFTAIIGWLLFGETLTFTWWFGASLITVGLVLINHGSPQTEETNVKKMR
ncbi:hypothetical protein LSH36_664g00001 [Paralvinella palmiformis]|uniref:EamA domain-containing protein n=1 Tax=Paralvinella palmiformis TaxID=53620 RepID=A0AAD9J3H7_9ANNE|nr:hypothetical protein LSH36_664g00001 [Paralvinella palmiformis]